MSWRLRDLRGEQAQRGGQAGLGAGLCAPRKLAAYKRPSVRGLLVPAPMTSAHRCGGRWSRLGALSQTTGVGASPGGEFGRRSIITKEDKGVMET